ncbi:MAG: cytochrome c3 family protein [Gemmataceae bacterium]
MAQIFHRSFNVISKLTIFGFLLILVFAGWVYAQYVRSDYVTGVGNAPEQPVPFSHRHHVSGLGIDCRYCHTSVEDSSFAGVPATRICMNCHSQIWINSPLLEPVRDSYRTGKSIAWTRIHNLAGFAYFDHSIHVKKGVGCATCHGRIDLMPLTYQHASLYMEWCLECHRNPERYVRPRDKVFDMAWQPEGDQLEMGRKLVKEYKIERRTSCSVCHR